MNYWLLSIPLLSAFVGWLTINLAVKLLFKPYVPISFLGFKIHGVFPARKDEIARAASNYAATQFADLNGLEQKISDPKNFENVKPLIEDHMDDFLRNRLKEQMPMISMFIGDKTISSLKAIFIQEIEDLFPQVMLQFSDTLKQQFNIKDLVREKIKAISPEQLTNLAYTQLNKQLRSASMLGTGIGLLTGLIQLAIILLSS
ncbi:DUF445 domain-containing protein [Terrimonas pollutisoli]|uniref:DUF445 domain-containing protein n=1 Tax=Terrimonas pollutisoli TaxID=3034147 RepID=UPI0023ED3A5F|nr:hypothetical protein [Terrimonas sp. H1YJ31]